MLYNTRERYFTVMVANITAADRRAIEAEKLPAHLQGVSPYIIKKCRDYGINSIVEFRPDGSVVFASAASGPGDDPYIISPTGECSCPALVPCWHLTWLAILNHNGDGLDPVYARCPDCGRDLEAEDPGYTDNCEACWLREWNAAAYDGEPSDPFLPGVGQ